MYEHVVKVMSHVVKHCPDKAMDKLEEVSYLMKHDGKGKKINKDEFLKTSIVHNYAKPAEEGTKASTKEAETVAKPWFKVSI